MARALAAQDQLAIRADFLLPHLLEKVLGFPTGLQMGQGAFQLALEVADPQQTLDPGEQLELVDGLGEKIIGAGIAFTPSTALMTNDK